MINEYENQSHPLKSTAGFRTWFSLSYPHLIENRWDLHLLI